MPSRTRKPTQSPATRKAASRPRRKSYHHGDLCNALLETAAQAIREHGVAELRMRELTRRLGVSHGAPANHFKDREELLIALAIQGFERLTALQRQVLEGAHATPAAALDAIGVAYVAFARDNPAHFEVMFQRGLLTNPGLATAAARCFEQLLGAVAALDPKRSRERERNRGDRELVALGAWAMVHGLATLHVQGLLPGGSDADVAKLTARILTALGQLGLSPARQTPPPSP
jgi:AcrR family transcriptional regulator